MLSLSFLTQSSVQLPAQGETSHSHKYNNPKTNTTLHKRMFLLLLLLFLDSIEFNFFK